jgi:hypothetical protein
MQRLHHRNSRHHRIATALGDQQQQLGRRLPLFGVLPIAGLAP